VPERLPTTVDLVAYHAAEMMLAAGGAEPAVLELDADAGTLTLTATGVARAARPAVLERLLARVTALGGTLTTDAPNTVRLRLPLVPKQSHEEQTHEEQSHEEQSHEEQTHEEQSHEERGHEEGER